ncbi:MAG TPA: hypothetical protein VN176_03600 [Verrucomicrobiae bacterium]|jgi:hypothetical protein|nr:hypothetical protein [Verrucomicrobiae bacterium]
MPMLSLMNRFIAKIPLVLVLVLSSVLLQDRAGAGAHHHHHAVATGTWGGEHIVLTVSDKGAEVEFDCAHGAITQPMTLDKHGDFSVTGSFTPEHGGPVLRDENTPSAAARYSGHVAGDTMSLSITRGEEKIGTYTLTRGSHPMLRKCR